MKLRDLRISLRDTLTISSITQRLGVYLLPKLYKIAGYYIFFWSNETGESIHVHISKGKPIPNATKVWLTRNGGCIVAHNKGKIPQNNLFHLKRIIEIEYLNICNEWEKFFGSIKFYC
ncbi:MAG: DUF4160 domain-containing protein [Oscillospiraceae bacterium]|nr:DUF4160 domain-containing protein [Oscillospiraceae bacterium]